MRYTVRYHDTLGNIASRFGVSVDAIMRANGLHHYHVYPGQVLWIPVHVQYHQHDHYYHPSQPPYHPAPTPYHGQSTQYGGSTYH